MLIWDFSSLSPEEVEYLLRFDWQCDWLNRNLPDDEPENTKETVFDDRPF
jgi:hypothetical protein